MQDNLQPIIHKAPVNQLRLRLAQSGLSIGDKVEMRQLDDGGIGVFATLRRRWLGLFSRRVDMLLGELAESASNVVAPALERGDVLRVRIVDLTPEHLARDSTPGLHISIWGDPAHMASPGTRPPAAASDSSGADTPPPASRAATARGPARPVNGASRPGAKPTPKPVPQEAQERSTTAAQPAESPDEPVTPDLAPDPAPKGVIFRKSRIHDGPAG